MAQARKLRGPFQEEDAPQDNGPMPDFPNPGMGDLGEAPLPEAPPDVRARAYPNPGQGDLGPAGIDPRTGRGDETARERGNNPVAPKKPTEPSPMASTGSTMQAPMPGVLPFKPLPPPQGNPVGGGLFGSMGGLKGGGLGLPLDPVSDVASDPIDTLMQLLMKRG